MRRAFLAVALLCAGGMAVPPAPAALGREEPVHPAFALSMRDLEGLLSGVSAEARAAVAARPADFLGLMETILDGPQDLLRLVDKTHALPADYAPPDLVVLNADPALFRRPLRTAKPDMKLRALLVPDLSAMSAQAEAAGAALVISSAWRSFQYQEGLFASALARQARPEVEKTLAAPGHSQHQLGTAIDFGSIDLSFARTRAGRWLAENAWAFGFSLSYPEGLESLTGYSWEPWHYRYIGPSAARIIRDFFGGRQQEFLEFYAEKSAAFAQRRRR